MPRRCFALKGLRAPRKRGGGAGAQLCGGGAAGAEERGGQEALHRRPFDSADRADHGLTPSGGPLAAPGVRAPVLPLWWLRGGDGVQRLPGSHLLGHAGACGLWRAAGAGAAAAGCPGGQRRGETEAGQGGGAAAGVASDAGEV